MYIDYFTDQSDYRLRDKMLLRRWLREVAHSEGLARTDDARPYRIGHINYVFCSSERELELNRQYLGHDYFTDIITFDDSDLEAGVIAGDIFIDVETVADNALKYNALPLDEMHRVIVHGVLHLCGQGDKTPDTEREMHRLEDKYLALLAQMRTE